MSTPCKHGWMVKLQLSDLSASKSLTCVISGCCPGVTFLSWTFLLFHSESPQSVTELVASLQIPTSSLFLNCLKHAYIQVNLVTSLMVLAGFLLVSGSINTPKMTNLKSPWSYGWLIIYHKPKPRTPNLHPDQALSHFSHDFSQTPVFHKYLCENIKTNKKKGLVFSLSPSLAGFRSQTLHSAKEH